VMAFNGHVTGAGVNEVMHPATGFADTESPPPRIGVLLCGWDRAPQRRTRWPSFNGASSASQPRGKRSSICTKNCLGIESQISTRSGCLPSTAYAFLPRSLHLLLLGGGSVHALEALLRSRVRRRGHGHPTCDPGDSSTASKAQAVPPPAAPPTPRGFCVSESLRCVARRGVPGMPSSAR
jgi:hypothetical protein